LAFVKAKADMDEQGHSLSRVSELVDRGELRSTQTQTLSPINVENLKKASLAR
jgi:NADPH:quinone reductase